MKAVEFTAELSNAPVIAIPEDIAVQLPMGGRVRVIVLDAEDDTEWRLGAYQQFLRDDSPEDAIYDSIQ